MMQEYAHQAKQGRESEQYKLTALEATMCNLFSEAGWTVYRNGWPDFLCAQQSDDGSFLLMAVEVKYGRDVVSPAQRKMHEVLEMVAGIPVYVVRHPREGNRVQHAEYERWRDRRKARLATHEDEEEWIG